MSQYKKKRVQWLATNFSKELDRIIELSHKITEKYDDVYNELLNAGKDSN